MSAANYCIEQRNCDVGPADGVAELSGTAGTTVTADRAGPFVSRVAYTIVKSTHTAVTK